MYFSFTFICDYLKEIFASYFVHFTILNSTRVHQNFIESIANGTFTVIAQILNGKLLNGQASFNFKEGSLALTYEGDHFFKRKAQII